MTEDERNVTEDERKAMGLVIRRLVYEYMRENDARLDLKRRRGRVAIFGISTMSAFGAFLIFALGAEQNLRPSSSHNFLFMQLFTFILGMGVLGAGCFFTELIFRDIENSD